MALSNDTPRSYSVRGTENVLPVQASSTIYAGSAVSIDAGGEVGPLAIGDAGFVGFAIAGADNSSGAAGAIGARVRTKGEIELVVAGMDDNDHIGGIVYASDDNTFSVTNGGSDAPIGKVSQIVSLAGNRCRVKFTSVHNEHYND